jgi:hypothetical protein
MVAIKLAAVARWMSTPKEDDESRNDHESAAEAEEASQGAPGYGNEGQQDHEGRRPYWDRQKIEHEPGRRDSAVY